MAAAEPEAEGREEEAEEEEISMKGFAEVGSVGPCAPSSLSRVLLRGGDCAGGGVRGGAASRLRWVFALRIPAMPTLLSVLVFDWSSADVLNEGVGKEMNPSFFVAERAN
jgi:hypothetical protein